MKILILLFIIHYSLFTIQCFSQSSGLGVNTTGAAADNSAMLDLSATGRGFLIPRMTTANRPASPAESLLIYNIDTQCFEAYNATVAKWMNVACLGGCTVPVAPDTMTPVTASTEIAWKWNSVSGVTGYKWSTTNDYSSAIATSPSGSSSYTQTGLTCNSSYTIYVWAYNACGKNSSATVLTSSTTSCSGFTCGDNLIDSRDGRSYGTVQIGIQCWMKENLRATRYNDNTFIPNVSVNNTWAAFTTGAYCFFGNITANGSIAGLLYNWYAATNTKGLCPAGWHLPSNADWTKLSDFLGGEAIAGGKMKEDGTAHWKDTNVCSITCNSTGFTGLPGGERSGLNGTFAGWGAGYLFTIYGHFWSSTENTNPDDVANMEGRRLAYGRGIYNDDIVLANFYLPVTSGVSVRCLKD